MPHIDNHDEITSTVFRRICDETLAGLEPEPPIGGRSKLERAEYALTALLGAMTDFCGLEEGFVSIGHGFLSKLPIPAQLIYTIADIVDFDRSHFHEGGRYFWKEPIIKDFLTRAGVKDLYE